MKVQHYEIPEECISACLRHINKGQPFNHADLKNISARNGIGFQYYQGQFASAFIARKAAAGNIIKNGKNWVKT